MDDTILDDFGNPLYPVSPVDQPNPTYDFGDSGGMDMTGGSAGNTDDGGIDMSGGSAGNTDTTGGATRSSAGGNWWDSILGTGGGAGGISGGIRKALGIGGSSTGAGGGLLDNADPMLLAGGAGMLLSGLFNSKSSGGAQVQPVAFPSSNLSPTQLVQANSNPGNVIGTPVAPVQPTNLGRLITPQQISPVAPMIGR
jgi:hypothetical protein